MTAPLEWQSDLLAPAVHIARSGAGLYMITQDPEPVSFVVTLAQVESRGLLQIGRYNTLEEAQAAAEKDSLG